MFGDVVHMCSDGSTKIKAVFSMSADNDDNDTLTEGQPTSVRIIGPSYMSDGIISPGKRICSNCRVLRSRQDVQLGHCKGQRGVARWVDFQCRPQAPPVATPAATNHPPSAEEHNTQFTCFATLQKTLRSQAHGTHAWDQRSANELVCLQCAALMHEEAPQPRVTDTFGSAMREHKDRSPSDSCVCKSVSQVHLFTPGNRSRWRWRRGDVLECWSSPRRSSKR